MTPALAAVLPRDADRVLALFRDSGAQQPPGRTCGAHALHRAWGRRTLRARSERSHPPARDRCVVRFPRAGRFFASRTLRNEWQRLASTVARTAIFLVDLGFLSGSLLGDDFSGLNVSPGTAIPPAAFAVAWAVALFGVAFWAGRAGRRWTLNLAVVFGGIHFCVQWFAHLGATPVSVLAAGVIVLVFAMILRRVNRRAAAQLSPSRAFSP